MINMRLQKIAQISTMRAFFDRCASPRRPKVQCSDKLVVQKIGKNKKNNVIATFKTIHLSI